MRMYQRHRGIIRKPEGRTAGISEVIDYVVKCMEFNV